MKKQCGEGFIDKTGKVVLRFQGVRDFSERLAFVQGLAHVSLGDGEFGYINHRGAVVFRYRPEAAIGRTNPYSVN